MLRFEEDNRADCIQLEELVQNKIDKNLLEKIQKDEVTLGDGEDLDVLRK